MMQMCLRSSAIFTVTNAATGAATTSVCPGAAYKIQVGAAVRMLSDAKGRLAANRNTIECMHVLVYALRT